MGAPRVDLGADGDLFVGEDVDIEMEVIDRASTINPATGAPVPPAQWVPLDVSTGYAFTYDLRREPASAAPLFTPIACTIVGSYNASRAVNTQRVRARLNDTDHTAASVVGANGGLYWYSFKRTTDGAERIALWGQQRFTRATQA